MIRRPFIIATHALLLVAAYLLAFGLRFDFNLPGEYRYVIGRTLPFFVVVGLIVFARYRLYEGLWRYTSTTDAIAILKAVTVTILVFIAATALVFPEIPRSVYGLTWIMTLSLVCGVRLVILIAKDWRRAVAGAGERRALVVGAGDAADGLIRAIQESSGLDYTVVGLIDDDRRKHRRHIRGVNVLGRVDLLPSICSSMDVDEVLLAIPSATVEEQRHAVELCLEAGVPVRSVPPLRELLEGRASILELREVQPEDLLGREAVKVDVDRLREEIEDKAILVTGAAGSIGSELCRQIAAFKPRALILYERAESNLYFAHLDLRQRHPDVDVIPVIGDILDGQKMLDTLNAYRVDAVYHAAAYKHVPLMEASPIEAIRNNVFGTEVVARAAQEAGVGRFVLISTDKAVAPAGVMGMTKRVAEGLLLMLQDERTTFVAVRFGNVLGSDGSVLPLFRWQLASGGPVTVTHRDATRYFMLISEAAQLVLQAGAMGRGGEVFFLDMGEPVKIMKLAEDLVRLSGLRPGRDVPIEEVGLRPGERLTEQLIRESERLLPTEHEKIAMSEKLHFDRERFDRELQALRFLADQRKAAEAVDRLKAMMDLY